MWWIAAACAPAGAPPAAQLPVPSPAVAPRSVERRPMAEGRYTLVVGAAEAGRLTMQVEGAAGPLAAAVVVDGVAWGVSVDGALVTATGAAAPPGALIQVAVHAQAGPDRAEWAWSSGP